MDDLDRVFAEADQGGVRLALAADRIASVRGDAVLFDAVQVPIVAMSVVACLGLKRGGESVHLLGARVGHTLMAAFPAFSRIGRYLQWSIRVRSVTADAIVFLEQRGLVLVSADGDRKATLSKRGREFMQKVRTDSEVAPLLRTLSVAAERTSNEDLRLL